MSPEAEMEHRVENIERDLLKVHDRHTSFEKTLMQINLSLESHYNDDKEMVQTMRNIDDKLNLLTVGMSDSKLDAFEALQDKLTPLYNICRKLETDLEKYKVDESKAHNLLAEKVERRIQYQATAVVLACWALAGIIYTDMHDDIKINTSKTHTHVAANK